MPPTPSRPSISSSGKSGASSAGAGGGVPGRGTLVATGSALPSVSVVAASSIKHRWHGAPGPGSVAPHFSQVCLLTGGPDGTARERYRFLGASPREHRARAGAAYHGGPRRQSLADQELAGVARADV